MKSRKENPLRTCLIIFGLEDEIGVMTPHTDAMVIMAIINNFKVERVLVDDGSSVNLLPYHVLQKIGIWEYCLMPVYSKLKGLEDIPIPAEEKIILPITLEETDSK